MPDYLNSALMGFIILVLLLWSMHTSLWPSDDSSAKSKDGDLYMEIGKISQRTSDIQTALETNRKSEKQELDAISQAIDKLSAQVSKLQDAGNTPDAAQELRNVKGDIAAIQQAITRLQAKSEKEKSSPVIINNN